MTHIAWISHKLHFNRWLISYCLEIISNKTGALLSLFMYAKVFSDLIRGEYESVLTIANFHFQKTPHTWVFPCLILCYNVMEVLLWRMPNNVPLCLWPGCSLVNACIVHRQWLQETQPSEKIKLLKTDMEPQNRHEYLLLQCFMFFQFRIKMHMWTTITGGIGLSSWTAEIMELNLCTTLPCFKRTRMASIQHIFTC